ncbi:putative ABC transport system permease protein [Pedobacter cryoconitis]|uniref:Putative ABC transport system permease protein n=1 Tax=Pedobacter cryoconitis TaxID=188932 RepID=A0A7W9DZV5_9SPHI|nr:ABC transporter permease [Pedobacter cryoconitis]MBB5636639.1 putative ABC transport system permease protein [Pedobacter cryoconitis]MBB6274633.1 putative ABC transport system permease protein [Pedobacter cryoconitis]
MKLFNLIRLALLALERNKLRALLTMLGIIIGVGSVITMMSIGEGSKESINASLSSMGSNMITITPYSNEPGGARLGGSSFKTLTFKDVEAMKKNAPDISIISPLASSSGQAINGANNWPTNIQGVTPEYLDIRKLVIKEGIVFSEQDVRASAKVCLLGKTVVDNLFPNGEDPIGKVIRFGKIPFQVIGVLVPKGYSNFGQDQDDLIIAPYTTIQKRITSSIYFGSIYASAINEGASDAAVNEINSILRESHRLRQNQDNDFQVRTQAELMTMMNSTSSMMTALLTAVASISLVIGGIGIMNIMYVSVTERTREIGLRMSIGARGIDILLQFLIEAVMISITGGVIGVVIGVSAALIVPKMLNWPTVISEFSIVISFVVCAVTGIFFGYYPALKASRLDPIEALRYE